MTKEAIDDLLLFESEDELLEVLELLEQHEQEFGTVWKVSPVVVAGKVGFVNWGRGEIVADPEFDDYVGALSYDTPYTCVKKNGQWGILCFDGNIETPFCYTCQMAMMLRDNLNMRIKLRPNLDCPDKDVA